MRLSIFTGSLALGLFFHVQSASSSDFSTVKKDVDIEDLIAGMTLDEKIGQMTQANKLSIDKNKEDLSNLALGSLLSGGGEAPEPNNPEAWARMVDEYQALAMQSRLKIPLLYGVDAVHGHGNVVGATIFPHNIGLGATRDPGLLQKIGRATALEVAATGIYWDFAPAVSVPRNLRWGRTYEGYSEDTSLVSLLSKSYIDGMQSPLPGGKHFVAATAKHFAGDGGTAWGTSTHQDFKIDQGDTVLDEATLRKIHIEPYRHAIAAGVQTIMVSYSSWNGSKMHGHRTLVTDVLKGELGFKGIVVSDWLAIHQLPGDVEAQVAGSINAGIDMVMAVDRYREVIETLKKLVVEGKVPVERIDDAVRRILTVKKNVGLFGHPFADRRLLAKVGGLEHRSLAREAVQKSTVLLKNESVLPLSASQKKILVIGQGANDLGLQSGGWTLKWQGHTGNLIPGTTILNGIRNQAPAGVTIEYLSHDQAKESSTEELADVAIVVVAEKPYAEGYGDSYDLIMSAEGRGAIHEARKLAKKIAVILLSGRPLLIAHELPIMDAFIAAWLPGSEGDGLGDLLWGKVPFSGKLSFAWPRTLDGYRGAPLDPSAVLFPFGAGLTQ